MYPLADQHLPYCYTKRCFVFPPSQFYLFIYFWIGGLRTSCTAVCFEETTTEWRLCIGQGQSHVAACIPQFSHGDMQIVCAFKPHGQVTQSNDNETTAAFFFGRVGFRTVSKQWNLFSLFRESLETLVMKREREDAAPLRRDRQCIFCDLSQRFLAPLGSQLDPASAVSSPSWIRRTSSGSPSSHVSLGHLTLTSFISEVLSFSRDYNAQGSGDCNSGLCDQ